MIALVIPVASPSLNQTHHRHWTAAFNLKKRWRRLIRDALAEGNYFPIPAPPQFATVSVMRYGRMLDFDNFVGGLKPVIDGLKEFRLISDDSPKHIRLDAQQASGVMPGITRITIQPRVP